MKRKLLNALLILTSLLGYLEWGNDRSAFLFQAEWEVLSRFLEDPLSVLHPLTVLPLFGQVVLLATLFQKEPGKALTLIGLGCIAILLVFICFIGLISLNSKIVLSTLPFIAVGVFVVRELRRKRNWRFREGAH